MNSTQTFTILDIVAAIFKSPMKFILWFLACFLLVILAYLIVPREYGSDGKLFVQVGRSSVGATPTTSAGTVSLQDSRETEIKSVVELLQSRELADRVVDVIGVERILKPNSALGRFINNLSSLSLSSGKGGTTAVSSETDLTSNDIKSLNQRNEAIKRLMQAIYVKHEKNTTVISIGAEAQTPFLARDIVQAYLEQYKKKHVKVHTPQGSGFFTEQLAIRKESLVEAEKKLEQFRSGFNVLDIGSARSLLQREIDQLKLDALDTAVKLSEAQERALQMTGAYAKVPEFIVGADKQTSSLARDKAREALYNLELQESEFTSRYNESNPKLSAIRNTISKAKDQLKTIPTSFNEAERSINPAHKEILVMLTKTNADASGYSKRLEATEALIASKIREVGKLNQMARTESQLYLDVEIKKKTMLGIAEKTAESVTVGALDSESISNVSIVQKACLLPKKIFPSGVSFAVFGGALSALVATIMTFLNQFKISYETDRKNRHRRHSQEQSNADSPSPLRSRRTAREQATSASGAVTESGHEEVQPVSASQSRSIVLQRRSENQVNVFMLLGGFGLVLAAYLLSIVLR